MRPIFRFVVGLGFTTLLCAATPPGLINYQGVLRDNAGMPLSGTYSMVFRLYDGPTVGTLKVTDSQSVVVTGGLFNVLLGSNAAPLTLETAFRDHAALYLEIQVGSQTLAPRVRIASAGYALNSTHLNGRNSSYYLDTSSTIQTKTGALHVGGGGSATGVRFDNHQIYQSAGDAALIIDSTGNQDVRFNIGSGWIRGANTIADVGELRFSNHNIYQQQGDNALVIDSSGNQDVIFDIGTGRVGIGRTPTARLDVAGTTKVQVLEITGADLAERFDVTEKVEPGIVVAIDPENPGRLCMARGAYNRRVAGVVSGSGDLPTGAVLGNLLGSEEHPAIALTSRVWVKAEAASHPIRPGDLLTTSDRPGYAMRAADPKRAMGAVIGKAMTPLASDRGEVLVLLSLQ